MARKRRQSGSASTYLPYNYHEKAAKGLRQRHQDDEQRALSLQTLGFRRIYPNIVRGRHKMGMVKTKNNRKIND